MGVKVATSCLNWSQPSVPRSRSSPQTLASSSISSPNSSIRRPFITDQGFLVCRLLERSSTPLFRSKFKPRTIIRACSSGLDEAFSYDEFSKNIQEVALKFQLSYDYTDHNPDQTEADFELASDSIVGYPSPFSGSKLEPPAWHVTDGDMIPASIERKANSVDLPFSLRIIKKKKKWEQGFRETGESANSPVKKAFSSMVFILRELQSYTLQMRGILLYENLQGILVRVQKEMNASFVWLFQQVFSHTPTLMVYVMILLANYSVHSMATNTAIAAATPTPAYATTTESVSSLEQKTDRFGSSTIKSFSVSSSSGKATSIGGNNGGGGKFRPVTSGTDGDGRSDGSDYYRTIVPDGVSSSIGNPRTSGDESVSDQLREEELTHWNLMEEEAKRLQAVSRDGSLDHETIQRFVSPVTAKIDTDEYADYFRTALLYQTGLVQDPSNPLLLANYAQFLYLVAHDYDRADEYFQRAVKVEPKDAEALTKYASFLWQVKKDLWAAEETYLEAIAVDPSNSYYAANYAHFLWSTGGEDTCFPLSSPDTNTTT